MDELTLLLEERAIMRLLHRYAFAMDYGHEEDWVAVFTDDAVFDVVEVVGGRRVHREDGRGELAQYVAQYPKPPHFRKHVVVDPIIDIADDCQSQVSRPTGCCCKATTTTGKPSCRRSGTTTDQWVKHDGRGASPIATPRSKRRPIEQPCP